MASVKPIVIDSLGNKREMQAGDTIAGISAASATVMEVEFDFGTVDNPLREAIFINTACLSTSKIMVWKSNATATNRADGDWDWDNCEFYAVPGNGSLTIKANAVQMMVGMRKVFYQIMN